MLVIAAAAVAGYFSVDVLPITFVPATSLTVLAGISVYLWI